MRAGHETTDVFNEKIIFSLNHVIVDVIYQQILQKFQTSDFQSLFSESKIGRISPHFVIFWFQKEIMKCGDHELNGA